MLSLIPRVLFASGFAAGALAAIDFSQIPQCAQAPIFNTIGTTKCDPTDTKCICGDESTVTTLTNAILQGCSGEDALKAIAFGTQLCPNLSSSAEVVTGTKTTSTTTSAETSTTSSTPETTEAESTTTESTAAESSAAESTTEASTTEVSTIVSVTPTASVTASSNGTVNGTGAGPEEFMGDAPGFGPIRLWTMALGIVTMGFMFVEL